MSRRDALFLISGASIMGYAVATLLFLRFWRVTKDRLFGTFGIAFAILAVQRLALSLVDEAGREAFYLYALRVAAFVVILWGIVDKNRVERD